MSVVFSPEVEDYLYELIEILYRKEYFGFKESSVQYVTDLILEIREKLPTSVKRRAPDFFQEYGKNLYYAMFKKSKVTQWYIFFSTYKIKEEIVYVVRYISNNHVIAQHL